MPEIYADWKSLKPLKYRVPGGTKCVVIAIEVGDKLDIGDIVNVEEDFDPAPRCVNTDGVHDIMYTHQLAILPPIPQD